jgi:hypothetical protein
VLTRPRQFRLHQARPRLSAAAQKDLRHQKKRRGNSTHAVRSTNQKIKMNEIILKIIRAAMKGEISVDVKTKGTACTMKKGKLVYKIRECEITMGTNKEFK